MDLTGRKIWRSALIAGLLVQEIMPVSCSFRHAQQSLQKHRPRMLRDNACPADTVPYTRTGSAPAIHPRADSLFIAAENQKIQGNAAYAARLFKDFLQIRPGNATAWYELALLNGKMKNAAATLQYARQAAALDTGNYWFAIALANAQAMNKNYDSAAAIFHGLSARYPGRQQYRYNEALMLSLAGKYEKALQLFDLLEKEAGVNEEFVYQKQRIFLEMKMPDSAAVEIRKLIDMSPGNSRYYGLLAQLYADNNQPDAAIGVYRSLLDKYPDNPQAMVALALFYKKKGADSIFKRYMTRAFGNPRFDIEKKIAFVYPYLKYVEIDSTKKEEALTLCRLIVRSHPGDARAHALYGDMLFRCGMPDSALQEYQKTLALDNSQYEVWSQLMLLYASGGNNDSLRHISGRAVKLFPREAGAWYFNGMALFFAGQIRPGIRSLEQALQLGIKDKDLQGRIYSTLGEAYNTLGRYSTSDSCFRTALHLNPEDDLTLNNYSYHLAERKAYLRRALQMIKTAVALKPGKPMYEDTYAWVLFNLGKYASAKRWMEKVLRSPGARDHPGYLEHYGDILLKNREKKKAVEYWKMAEEKGGDPAVLNWKISRKKLPPPRVLSRLYKRNR